mgnify:CR=1 FL=1
MNIPDEIFILILNYLDYKNFLKFTTLSKNIFNYSLSSDIWSYYYKTNFRNYNFNENTSNYRVKIIKFNKTKKIYKKLLKKISINDIKDPNSNLIFSNTKELNWLNNNKHLILKERLRKVRTQVRCHKFKGYFISTVYFINYDKIYFSNYFVNSSQCFDILYKLDY